VEIEETDYEILDTDDPQSEHWRGLQADVIDRLLIRRSLVRAQVGKPINSRGYAARARRNPFLFAILDSGSTSCASSLSPIATPRPSSGPSTERGEPASRRAPLAPRRRVRSYVRLRVWRQRSSIRRFRRIAVLRLTSANGRNAANANSPQSASPFERTMANQIPMRRTALPFQLRGRLARTTSLKTPNCT
jgi:hypothetical protein